MNTYEEFRDAFLGIDDHDVILVAGHTKSDYDSIGSSLALTRYLNKIGKKAFFLLEEKEYPKLGWYNYDYVISEYTGDDYVFVFLDSNRLNRLGPFENYFARAKKTFNIDHHEGNVVFADYKMVISEISATSEILYNLFGYFDVEIDKDIATLLYAGIVSDTYCFYQRVTPDTFKIASDLLGYGIDSTAIIKDVYLDRTEAELKLLMHTIQNVKFDGFHYVILDRSDDVVGDADYNVIYKKNISPVRNVKGVGLLLILLVEGGVTHGEFRSNCDFDVAEIALILGGGGHKKASGFISDKKPEEIIKIVKEYFNL